MWVSGALSEAPIRGGPENECDFKMITESPTRQWNWEKLACFSAAPQFFPREKILVDAPTMKFIFEKNLSRE